MTVHRNIPWIIPIRWSRSQAFFRANFGARIPAISGDGWMENGFHDFKFSPPAVLRGSFNTWPPCFFQWLEIKTKPSYSNRISVKSVVPNHLCSLSRHNPGDFDCLFYMVLNIQNIQAVYTTIPCFHWKVCRRNLKLYTNLRMVMLPSHLYLNWNRLCRLCLF